MALILASAGYAGLMCAATGSRIWQARMVGSSLISLSLSRGRLHLEWFTPDDADAGEVFQRLSALEKQPVSDGNSKESRPAMRIAYEDPFVVTRAWAASAERVAFAFVSCNATQEMTGVPESVSIQSRYGEGTTLQY